MMRWLKWARLVGVALLIWILCTIDWRRILPTLASLKLAYLLGYVFFFACMAAVRVVRLHICARKLGFPLRLADSYAATVEPMFLGTLTPGRIGEFSRVAYLNRHGMPLPSAIALALLERIIDLSVLLCFGAGGMVYLFGSEALRPYVFGLIGFLLVLLCFSFLASGFAIRHLRRLAAGFLRRWSLPGEDAQNKFLDACRQTIRATAGLMESLGVVCTLLGFCQIYMLAQAFQLGGSRIPVFFAYSVSTLMALLPIAPAGLGTREATYIYIMARLGIARERALLFSLVDGVVLGMLGSLAMVAPLWIASAVRRLRPARTADASGVNSSPLALVCRSIRRRGLLATVEYVVGEIVFDWLFRAETRTPVAVTDLAVTSASKAYAANYQGTGWFLLKRVFRSLNRSGRIDPATTCLIDFGCGKGRVLLASLHFGIGRVIGVEFDPRLCAIARRNLARYAGRRRSGSPLSWEVVHSDVLDFSIPADANLFFLYNPFSGPVLDAVAERIRQSCAESSRRRFVVYVNPVHEDVFRRLGFTTTSDSDGEVAIYALDSKIVPSLVP
jgi:uncharacterized protein (TIRG00374 family)